MYCRFVLPQIAFVKNLFCPFAIPFFFAAAFKDHALARVWVCMKMFCNLATVIFCDFKQFEESEDPKCAILYSRQNHSYCQTQRLPYRVLLLG